ncbi:MAG: hypothetical protein LBG72_10660 [Spirochaetaceae bacterium]|jgi:hypothetical protein|nr:hypothetical protein [Spirochaetaceae bacterium]
MLQIEPAALTPQPKGGWTAVGVKPNAALEEDLPLTRLYNAYKSGAVSRRLFEERIFQHIFDNARKYQIRFKNKDDCVDFICSLYPKLCGIIDNYQQTGHSFDAYIASTLRYSYMSQCYRIKNQEIAEYTCCKELEFEIEERETESASAELENEEQDIADAIQNAVCGAKTKAGKKHALILLLKTYDKARDEHIEKLSKAIGIPPENIFILVERLRSMREHAEIRIQKMKERVQTQYYRCLTYESRLKTLNEKPYHYDTMKRRHIRARQTLQNMRLRLSRMRRHATNKQIAELLNIPKATVDSCFISLRKRLEAEKQRT